MLTPHDSRRVSSYDIDEPFPWESEKSSDQQSGSRRETKRNSLHQSHHEDLLKDDYLFSSPTSAPIKPKPRLSLQTKIEDHHQTDEIPQSISPKTNLLNTDWLSDPQPTNENESEKIPHTEQRISSPPLNDSNTYADDDFDENDDSNS